MLVTVQYPVVDCRGLVSEESYKLVKPYFANPSPNEFMRNFGRVGRRDISYRDYCRNEDIFCHADNAVHMPAMYPVSEGVVAARARSRIFSNGANLYRVEVRMEVYAAEGVAWPEDLPCRMASVPLRVRGEGGRYVTCRVADAGGALGAALAWWHIGLDKPRTPEAHDAMRGSYLGPEFGSDEILKTCRRFQAPVHVAASEAELVNTVADLLDAGKVVGWFQGRMEYGPRALGNRSILGDPRNPEMQKRLNLKIKYREGFRPFAPSVLEEDVREYFDIASDSPYMLIVEPVRKDLRKPARFRTPCSPK